MVYHTKKTVAVDASLDELMKISSEKKNGKPNYGAILQCHRLRLGWTAETVALLYSEALSEKPISASWIYMLENQNNVLIDEKKRRILARLLDIPPLLFGLSPLIAHTITQKEVVFDVFRHEKVDIQEYRSTLEGYCASSLAGETAEQVRDVRHRVHQLHNTIHYTPSFKKKQLQRLLCEYLIFLAIAAHEQQYFEVTISLLSDAILVAEENKLYSIWAYALRQRGVAYLDRGELQEGLIDFHMAKEDFHMAVGDFDAARRLKSRLAPLSYGLVLNAAGCAYARVAQDEKQLAKALALSDESGNFIGADGDELTISARLDVERLHLTKGEALMPPRYHHCVIRCRHAKSLIVQWILPGPLRHFDMLRIMCVRRRRIIWRGNFPKAGRIIPTNTLPWRLGMGKQRWNY